MLLFIKSYFIIDKQLHLFLFYKKSSSSCFFRKPSRFLREGFLKKLFCCLLKSKRPPLFRLLCALALHFCFYPASPSEATPFKFKECKGLFFKAFGFCFAKTRPGLKKRGAAKQSKTKGDRGPQCGLIRFFLTLLRLAKQPLLNLKRARGREAGRSSKQPDVRPLLSAIQ